MWFLDSSVSFHMTLESTHLPSMLYPNSHLSRLFLSLDVTFFLLHLFMSLLFCISKLAMRLMCASQITDHDCRIILEVDSGSPTGASLGLGIMILRSFGSFTGCVFSFLSVWLCLPSPTLSIQSSSSASATATSYTTTFTQWHCRLCHLSGSRLSTLVSNSVLGLVSSDSALYCTGCKLGKQLQLCYLSNDSVCLCPFDLVYLGITRLTFLTLSTSLYQVH